MTLTRSSSLALTQVSKRVTERSESIHQAVATVVQTTHKVAGHSVMVTTTHTLDKWDACVSVWSFRDFKEGWNMLFSANENIEWHSYDSLHEQLVEKAELLLT